MRFAGPLVLLALLIPRPSAASGGGTVEVTRDLVQVTFETPRKRPMRGEEAAWAKQVGEWEKANQPTAEKIAAAIEQDVLPRHRQLPLVAKSFAGASFRVLSSEGVAERGGADDVPWRLEIDLDIFERGSNSSRARFIFTTRPNKTDIRAFSRDVRTAALAIVGRTLPPPPTYTAYWLSDSTLLLATVPLAKLTEALAAQPWRPMGFASFRVAPALVITTKARRYITRNDAGFLLANITGAKLEPGEKGLSYQSNGTWSPALGLAKAKGADVLKLLDAVVDPSLTGAATAEERTRVEDDAEFLSTLKPALAK